MKLIAKGDALGFRACSKSPPRSPIILFLRADGKYTITGKNTTLEELEKNGKMRPKKLKRNTLELLLPHIKLSQINSQNARPQPN